MRMRCATKASNLWIGNLHEGRVHAGRVAVEWKLLQWYVAVVELNVRQEPIVFGQPVSLARVKNLFYRTQPGIERVQACTR